MNVKEDIEIEAPPAVIYHLVNGLKKSELWNPFSLNDTSLITTYNEIPSGVGATSSWESTIMGSGSQKIVEAIANEKIRSILEFGAQPGVQNFADLIITGDKDESELTWTFESGQDIPFISRGMVLFAGIKSSMKKSYKTGLKNIKRIAEERSKENIYYNLKVVQKEMPERSFVFNRQEVLQ